MSGGWHIGLLMGLLVDGPACRRARLAGGQPKLAGKAPNCDSGAQNRTVGAVVCKSTQFRHKIRRWLSGYRRRFPSTRWLNNNCQQEADRSKTDNSTPSSLSFFSPARWSPFHRAFLFLMAVMNCHVGLLVWLGWRLREESAKKEWCDEEGGGILGGTKIRDQTGITAEGEGGNDPWAGLIGIVEAAPTLKP